MKAIILSIFLVLSGITSIYSQSNDIKNVEVAVEQLKKAMLDGDRSTLERLAHNDLTYGHSSGVVEDKATFVNALASGKSDFTKIELTHQKISITDHDIALVRHELHGEVNGNPVNLGVLTVWLKQKQEWHLLARQAFKL